LDDAVFQGEAPDLNACVIDSQLLDVTAQDLNLSVGLAELGFQSDIVISDSLALFETSLKFSLVSPCQGTEFSLISSIHTFPDLSFFAATWLQAGLFRPGHQDLAIFFKPRCPAWLDVAKVAFSPTVRLVRNACSKRTYSGISLTSL
jgi:hypothetical protein